MKRGLESVKDIVVVPIEARVVEQHLRLAPGADVISGEPVNENDHVFRLENLVPQMQQAALVMRLLAKPSLVCQPEPTQGCRLRNQRTRRQIVISLGKRVPDHSGNL